MARWSMTLPMCLAVIGKVSSFAPSPALQFVLRRHTTSSSCGSLPRRLTTQWAGNKPGSLRMSTSAPVGEAAVGSQSSDLLDLAVDILNEPCTDEKARKTLEARRRWLAGELHVREQKTPPPGLRSAPARPDYVTQVAPQKVQVKNRLALIHSLVHAESYAIDLMWDMMARFHSEDMPHEFYEDWCRVAADEARHYTVWRQRLQELGSDYGQMNAHRGLWDSADDTAGDLLARLAIVHLVHEARGLDVSAQCEAKMLRAHPPDEVSADILRGNYKDETTHVEAGFKWFIHVCNKRGIDAPPHQVFHKIVRGNFGGLLKGPFNKEARSAVGMTEEWYMPLSDIAEKEGWTPVELEAAREARAA